MIHTPKIPTNCTNHRLLPLKRTFAAAIFLAALLPAARGVAAEQCLSLENTSCWHATNDYFRSVYVSCDIQEEPDISNNVTFILAPDGLRSEQLDDDYGDGLGYPRASTIVTCYAAALDGPFRTAPLTFRTINWGDNVSLQVTPDGTLAVTVREQYGSRRSQTHESL